jgi:hypothetical protein
MLDFIGIGLGPFNLSLASLLHNKSSLNYAIFEQKLSLTGMQVCSYPIRYCKCRLWQIWSQWLIQPVHLAF